MARGGTQNLAGAVVAAVASVGLTLLVTRHFSKVVAGTFFTSISAFLIVEALAGLGAYVGLVYFIAQLRSLNDQSRIPAIVRAAVLPVIIASVLLTVCMLIFAGPLAHGIIASHKTAGVHTATVAQYLRALAFAVPFAALIDTFLGATRGYGDMRPTVVIDRIGTTVGQLLGVVVAIGLGSTALLAPLWAVVYVPLAGAAWLWLRRLRRHSGGRRTTLTDVPEELAALMALGTRITTQRSRAAMRRLANANPRGFWRFTVPRGAANLASTIIQRLDIVLIAVLKGPADAAIYTAATRFLVLGQFGNTALNRASQPRLAELFADDDLRGSNVLYQVTTGWLILLNWPLYLLAIVFGRQVLTLFGHSYTAGTAVMVILGFTMLFGSAMGQVDVVLITAGRSTWSLMNSLLVLGVNVGLDLLLIPKYGIIGAAIAWALAIVVSNLVPLAQLAKVFRLHPFGRGSLIAATMSAISFGVVPLAMRVVLGGWAAVAAGVTIGALLQAAGMWRFRTVLRLQAMPGVSAIRKRLGRDAG